jgi:hypothetical protein
VSIFSNLKPETVDVQQRGITQTIRWNARNCNDTDKKSLDFLLRQATSQYSLKQVPITSQSSNIFDPLFPGCVRPVLVPQPSDYNLYLRSRPSFDVQNRKLLVDVDLIPCLPSNGLDEVIFDLVGGKDVTQSHIRQLKHSLVGVHIRCNYIPGKVTGIARGPAQMLARREIGRGRVFQIRDVRLPSDDIAFHDNQDNPHRNTYADSRLVRVARL